MASRLRTKKPKHSGIQAQDKVNVPAQSAFESRSFEVRSQQVENPQPQPNLKTELMRAEQYGHHLSRMNPASPSVPAVTQPDMERGQQVELGVGKAPKMIQAKLTAPRDVLTHQATMGNWAVSRQLAGRNAQLVQAKLTVGEPGDKYEQEADQIAAEVVNQINSPVSLESSTVQREMPNEKDKLQPKSVVQRASDGGMAATAELESSILQARSGGQPLAEHVRTPMEQAFRADFSDVKVHTDTQSDELNQSIQARAFTAGQDVFFRQGEYTPGSRGGQELLAHELTHVVQQNTDVSNAQVQRVITPDSSKSIRSAPDPSKWKDTEGNIKWPPNDGLKGTATKIKLTPGTKVDRYGFPGGSFVSPEGIPYEQRSLAPGTESKPYTVYEILKEVEVESGEVAPWFDQPGGGIQHKFSKTVSELLADGTLK